MKQRRILLAFINGKIQPINAKLLPEWETRQRDFKLRQAGMRLAQIDWSKFRQPRHTLSDVGTYARIPDVFVLGYITAYKHFSSGRV